MLVELKSLANKYILVVIKFYGQYISLRVSDNSSYTAFI